MGYNISDVGGQTSPSGADWTATLDLTNPAATTVSGDFDVVWIFGGSLGEATDGYTFSALSNPSFGTLTTNSVDGTYTFVVDRNAVIASGSDQVVNFTVTGTSGGNSDTDTVSITILICVARGTRIRTDRGEVPVESLGAGDMVETLDGTAKPVRWIGSRRIGRAELESDNRLWPVRIRAGALGEGQPARDLLVSPQHRICLEDWRAELMFGESRVLVPAKSLIDDSSVLRERDLDEVEYFHLLFDDHEIIFTEGAPTESFFPGRFTLSELDRAAREELLRLFPELEQGYGDLACQGLKAWEASLLAAQRGSGQNERTC